MNKEHENLAPKKQTIANQRFTTTYSYDENDRMTQQTYPSGRVIGYEYNRLLAKQYIHL